MTQLQAFTFGNIRCFAGMHHTMPLARLTLIIGGNSRGKTTILQSLAMLLQSFRQPTPNDEHAVITNGSIVRAGLYEDLLPNEDPNARPTLGLTINGISARWSFRSTHSEDDFHNQLRLEHLSVRGLFVADRILGNIRVSSQIGRQILKRIAARELSCPSENDWNLLTEQELPSRGLIDEAVMEGCLANPEEHLENIIRRTLRRYRTQNMKVLSQRLTTSIREALRSDERCSQCELSTLLHPLDCKAGDENDEEGDEGCGSFYVLARGNGHREGPSHAIHAILRDSFKAFIDLMELDELFGNGNPNVFYSAGVRHWKSTEHMSLAHQETLAKKFNHKQVRKWLYALDGQEWQFLTNSPAKKYSNRQNDRMNAEMQARLFTGMLVKRGTTTLRPEYLEEGFQQALPFLMQLPQGGIHLIQQPELHLHPRAQAQIGMILADACTTNTESTQIIVETHSEHLLRAVQGCIRRNQISANDVQIIAVEESPPSLGEITPWLRSISIRNDGSLDGCLPSNFFPGLSED